MTFCKMQLNEYLRFFTVFLFKITEYCILFYVYMKKYLFFFTSYRTNMGPLHAKYKKDAAPTGTASSLQVDITLLFKP